MFEYTKDPDATIVIWQVWASADATNDNGTTDTGYLKSRTISNVTVPAVSGLTTGTAAVNSGGTVTHKGVTYAVNTVVSVQVSGGTSGSDYEVVFRVTLSDGTIDDMTVRVLVRPK